MYNMSTCQTAEQLYWKENITAKGDKSTNANLSKHLPIASYTHSKK